MMPSGEQANIIGLRSREFVAWIDKNLQKPLKTGPGKMNMEGFGVISRSSPRQVDVLLLNGPISLKLRPVVRRLYEQMAEPKWVIAMGECTICGGPYYDSYSIVKGSYPFRPTDIFIPGCPVRPEALIDGFLKLSAKIRAEKSGWVRTKKGRLVSAREGQLMNMGKGEYTYEVPQVRS